MSDVGATEPYVFLSYASADRERALALADALEAAGVRVWVDRRAIAGGSSWNEAIVRGIERCAALVLLTTPAAVRSRNVQRELQLAVEFDRAVLPLRLEEADYPAAMRYALAGVQWVDVLDRPRADWLSDVVRALGEMGAAATAPAPPPSAATPSASAEPPPPTPASNLPAALTSFIGRDQEREDVARLLQTARLVTLTGPGGTGKTRLSLAVAERVRDGLRDGVWFVDLAPVSDPALVAAAVAQTLGVRESEAHPVAASLRAYLREKRLLLVLDNFEQVVEAAPLLRDLLAGAPGLTALVTSRVVLSVTGEHEYAVRPLPFPDAADSTTYEDIARNPAVTLFVERARAVKGDFALTLENAAAVAEICARLDGLPLAIELAASRVRLLTPEAIRARLDERLTLLTGGPRDLPARQRTLRGAIQWSYDLLDEQERTLFRRLSVFAGGCTLEAAGAVCDAEGDLGLDVLDGVASLMEKSLLRQLEGPDGAPRFAMLATIREFAAEQLAAGGEGDMVQRAHASYLLALVRQAGRGARPADVRRVAAELPNIRAALAWCVSTGELGVGARILWPVHYVGTLLGVAGEFGAWAERLLASPAGAEPSVSRARLLWVAGVGAEALGDGTRWRTRLEDAIGVSRAVGDTGCLMHALRDLGRWHLTHGSPDAARALLEESLALCRGMGDQRVVVWALQFLVQAVAQQGDPEAARALADESLRAARAMDDPAMVALGLLALGQLAERDGDRPTARRRAEEALSLFGETGENAMGINARTALARLWLDDGAAERAMPRLAEGLALARRLGILGDLHGALVTAARVALARGAAASAARLLGAADAQGERAGTGNWDAPPEATARYTAAVRAALGEDAFAAAYEDGRALSADAAVELALAQTTDTGGGR